MVCPGSPVIRRQTMVHRRREVNATGERLIPAASGVFFPAAAEGYDQEGRCGGSNRHLRGGGGGRVTNVTRDGNRNCDTMRLNKIRLFRVGSEALKPGGAVSRKPSETCPSGNPSHSTDAEHP